MSAQHLSEMPDWSYLLQEFYRVYRSLSAGGSDQIRSHQRQVREAISRTLKANPPLHFDLTMEKPVTEHLTRALNSGKQYQLASIVRSIESVAASLNWQYGYEKMPRGLETKFAYAEFCGPSGPILTKEVILGVVLFAPKCIYPSHSHDGITESYICLSGTVSENHQGVYAPGSLIYNPPQHAHRITVSEQEPALLSYAWIGPQEMLGNQKMTLGRKRGES
jgi:dimethylpropiothetin dethiomethylase